MVHQVRRRLLHAPRVARPRRGTAPCARDGAGCRAWIWPPPVSGGLDRRVRPQADTASLVRGRWQLAWGGASPNLLARAGWLAQYGAATAAGAPPYWGMRCSLLPAADQNRSNDVLMPEIGMTALSLTAFLALLSKGLQADEGAVCRPCSAVFGVPWRRKWAFEKPIPRSLPKPRSRRAHRPSSSATRATSRTARCARTHRRSGW